MDTNPFRAPREVKVSAGEKIQRVPQTAKRAKASKYFKLSILILAVPAIANLSLFNYFLTRDQLRRPQGLTEAFITSQLNFVFKATGIELSTLATVNVIVGVIVIFGLLFLGFSLLESYTRAANRTLRCEPQLSLWCEALYAVLGQAFLMAIPVAILWAICLCLDYGTEIPALIYELPFAILVCLMAAISRRQFGWAMVQDLETGLAEHVAAGDISNFSSCIFPSGLVSA